MSPDVNPKVVVEEDQGAHVGLDERIPDCGKADSSDYHPKEMVADNNHGNQTVLKHVDDCDHNHSEKIETHVGFLTDHAYGEDGSATFHETEKSHAESFLTDYAQDKVGFATFQEAESNHSEDL